MIETIIQLIGNLVLPYLALGLLASLLVELVSRILRLREKVLQQSIETMLEENGSIEFPAAVYSHPIIKSLAPPSARPDYIPGQLFALVFIDVVRDRVKAQTFRDAVAALPDGNLQRALRTVLQYTAAGGEAKAVQGWFLAVMDRASGIYRWHTAKILTIVATIVVLTVNFDAIRISDHIVQRDVVEKLVEARIDAVADQPGNIAKLDSLHRGLSNFSLVLVPIGWSTEPGGRILSDRGLTSSWLMLKLIGLLVSVLAIVLIAPLMFDLLNKITVIRMTVKPWEQYPAQEIVGSEVLQPAVAPAARTGEEESHP